MSFVLSQAMFAELDAANRIAFPAEQFQQDPVGFYRTILGIDPWEKQVECLEGMRDHPFGAVSAGRKVSKSNTIAGGGLWRYCCWPDAQVVFMSTTSRQVERILWLEVQRMVKRSGRCLDCARKDPRGVKIPRPCPHSAIIPEIPAQRAHTGMKSEDFRSLVGYTARDAVAAQGTSGANLFYFVDEATGVPDPVIHALYGNCAGGGGVWFFFNPTRNDGEASESFLNAEQRGIKAIRISSEDSPNVKAGRVVIPGLATLDYIERMRKDWGVESPLYQIHVLGKHVRGEDGKAISAHLIHEAIERWHETAPTGRLVLGLDPAGEGGQGDEIAFALRRGYKMIDLRTWRGLDTDAILAQLLLSLATHRAERETPIVVVDAEGSIGAPLGGVLARYAEDNPGSFEVVRVKSSQRMPPTTTQIRFDRVRDALWGNLRDWLQNGGTLIDDPKLHKELNAPEFKFIDAVAALKVTRKEDLRAALGRSPDRADALALAVWERGAVFAAPEEAPTPAADVSRFHDAPTGAIDPYAGLDAFGL